jgi:putative nucleotidyltransferase with HDIG domain
MELLSIVGVGRTLGSAPRTLVAPAMERVHDRALVSNPEVDAALEVIIDRFCLSLTLSKPVGLATWAEREGKRFGPAGASELASAGAHAIAAAARRYGVDHGRLLATLELLKDEVERGLAPLRTTVDPESWPSDAATNALLAMLAERDYDTCCHSKATGEWARRLAVAMHLPAETVETIEISAILHDIGKVATPERILFKPGALTEPEWELMREHAAAGARILDQIPSLRRYASVVRAHHERWDGKGYPDGQAGDSIPLEARVVAVADGFHAMISDRPYRKAIAPRQALGILSDGRGTQWDPEVVDAMLGLFTRSASTQRSDEKTAVSSAS